jgi:hypothetical protein
MQSPIFIIDLRERRAGREEDSPVGMLDCVLEGAFGERGGVGEGEDDGAGVYCGHGVEDGGGECALRGGCFSFGDRGFGRVERRGEYFTLMVERPRRAVDVRS